MKFIVLDDFPLWTTYVLFVLVLCSFVLAFVLLIRSLVVTKRSSGAARVVAQSGRQSLFFTLATGVGLGFLCWSMFFRFHVLGLDASALELGFFWPRPPRLVAISDVVEVRFLPAYRTCGHMEVLTKSELLRSVNFKDCKVFEQLRDEFTARFAGRRQ